MIVSLLKNRISELCPEPAIVVLKGFPVKTILSLKEDFTILDDYVYKGESIDLGELNFMKLFQLIVGIKDKTCIICYESYQAFTQRFNGLSDIGRHFCVITNNLLSKYENPSTVDIPDFDSPEFQDTEGNNELYMNHYSFCRHENGKQYVEYIDNILDDYSNVTLADFVTSVPVKVSSKEDSKAVQLSVDDGSIDRELENLFYNGKLCSSLFSFEKHIENEYKLGVLQHAADLFEISFKFCYTTSNFKTPIRPELYDYLKETWGYESFRDLKIYKNLQIDRESINISQGEIIETVIKQSEASVNNPSSMKNVLLTSPTGAGKSLLFQLAAIYLAEKYKYLTIVVSPLVALMNDQVDNLVGNYKGVATLNGNKTAIEKESIINSVKKGEINILYLAPELLLSYAINSFIGERRIGLLVVDEAHTVTTWGRDFRVDYWFLGDYLRNSKRVLKYNFPIFALTATAVWDPSGRNDMVFDTIRSLNMDPCINYIGVVRRNDISFDINTVDIQKNYETKRSRLTINRIHEFLKDKNKAIVYFPFKSTINTLMKNEAMEDCSDQVALYHASLNTAEKNSYAEAFKSGEKPIMCATKAYGMGVDVSDIKIVYHHAPTGSLSDYVQEIGRVARDPQIQGIAKIDFCDKDLKYINSLHGLSAIRSYQIRAVLKKLMALYKMKGEKRNMLISAEDFDFIFPGKDVDYDQKVKSCLLLLSNDLKNKLQFDAIIVRPKNLFSKSYICVPKAQRNKFEREYGNYIHLVDSSKGIYKLDSDNLWSKKYVNYSFPNFKRLLANNEIFKSYNIEMRNRVELNLADSLEVVKNGLIEFFDVSNQFLDWMAIEHKRLDIYDMKLRLPSQWSSVKKEAFMESFDMIYAADTSISDHKAYCRLYKSEQDGTGKAYQLVGHGYERLKATFLDSFDKFIKDKNQVFYCKVVDRILNVCELLNSLNLADYQKLGGDQPAIFIRINNPFYLNNLVRRGDYENDILKSIYEKFDISREIFKFFFKHEMPDKERWDFIENYFLGTPVEELIPLKNRGI